LSKVLTIIAVPVLDPGRDGKMFLFPDYHYNEAASRYAAAYLKTAQVTFSPLSRLEKS